ncbi:hypothetical protein COL154_014415, partial [Colletotrichum chrysophilum]
MATRNDPKRNKVVAKVVEATRKLDDPSLDPHILFDRASNDELERYTPEMLALSAVHAKQELTAWDHRTPRITIRDHEGIEIDGAPVSILSITGRDMPFLFDSVMGEVSSTVRDIYLAVHPILLLRGEHDLEHYSPDKHLGTSERVSHIQLHLPHLAAAAADELIKHLKSILKQVHAAVEDWPAM